MNKRKILVLLFLAAAVAAIGGFCIKQWAIPVLTTSTADEDNSHYCVVIDAGHGGNDPGKVGVNGALEKDINLSIALKLKDLLELNDVDVIMIRETDTGLYSETDTNKKSADMKKRVSIINESNADLVVSIHQNSFSQESSHGAQVFYYNGSTEGKTFAELMQETLRSEFNDGNKRLAKANTEYYMLKKTTLPLIIIECGFLSNNAEAELLSTSDYQERMAWAIHLGIMTWLNKE